MITTNYYFDHLNFDFYLLMSSFLSNSLSSRGRLDQLPNVSVPGRLLRGLLLQSLDLFLPLLLVVLDSDESLLFSKDRRSLLGRILELRLHLVHFRHWRLEGRSGIRRRLGDHFRRGCERRLLLDHVVGLSVHATRHTHRVCHVHCIVRIIVLVEGHLDARLRVDVLLRRRRRKVSTLHSRWRARVLVLRRR